MLQFPEHLKEGHRRKVLIVDDSAIARKLLNRMITSYGFDVVEAADGREALDLLKRPVEEIIR